MPTKPTDLKGRVLKRLARMHLTQSDLARRMGTTPQALGQILTTGNPRLRTLERLAVALECEPGELVGC